ncbi:hypothetical protein Pf1_02447 [Flavobacterium columnare]|nr:hypothetical protein Pf1_02447 [Flavobacterium columnare]
MLIFEILKEGVLKAKNNIYFVIQTVGGFLYLIVYDLFFRYIKGNIVSFLDIFI